MNLSNKISLKITRCVGSTIFFLSLTLFNSGWILWNHYAPKEFVFDPSPTFQTWLFISNIIQIELMPLILLAGNLQTDRMERLIARDLKVDKEARERGEKMLSVMEEIKSSILKKEKS